MNQKIFGKIFLASNSPRRNLLLSEAGFDVEVIKGRNIKEKYPSTLPVHDIPSFLSRIKASAYSDVSYTEHIPLVAADTLVILDGIPLGKPADQEECILTLQKLSNKWHSVVTGVTLLLPDTPIRTFDVETKVKFSQLSDTMINYYVDNFKPFDKAGAYGIQEWIGMVGVEKIEGDFYNIMGFPVNRFITEYLSLFPLHSEKG